FAIFDAIGAELVELPAELAELCALASDLLAEETGGEQHAAEDEAGLDQLPDGSHAGVRDQKNDAGQDAQRDDADAQHAEKEEWLVAEAQLEPHGQHVEHADWNAMPRGELRFAGVPRIERYRNFGYRKALRGRHHHHVAMPIRTCRQRLHHLS